jgi:enterochelin esterase-like enzyme
LSGSRLQKYEKMRSRLLRNERDVIVYLPPGYDDQPQRHFPVLYLQDGQNLFDPETSFIKGMYWRVGETADQLIGAGAIQPLIVVGIYNRGKQRINEYTPVRMPRLGGGRAIKYTRMLREELIPFIASQHRVLPGPENTGLGGSSLGGLFTLYAGLSFPDLFGKLAVLSPSVWWGGGWIRDFAEDARIGTRARIWLDAGTNEGPRVVPGIERMRDVLLSRGWSLDRDLHFEIFEGGEHNENAWAKRVGAVVQFLFPAG